MEICFIIMFIMEGKEALLIRKWAAADNQAGTSLSLSFETRRQGEGRHMGGGILRLGWRLSAANSEKHALESSLLPRRKSASTYGRSERKHRHMIPY